MRIVRWIPFILLFIGTTGLLVNEFAAHWGRTATLIFAVLNTIGLVIVVVLLWNIKGRNWLHQ